MKTEIIPLINEFEIEIPVDYNHEEQLDLFYKKTKDLKTTFSFDEGLNSKNFSKATNKLEPGKRYKVKFFEVNGLSNEECLFYLKIKKVILVGGQGMTLVQDLRANELPINRIILSFDEKSSMFEDSGIKKFPVMIRYPDDLFIFGLGRFDGINRLKSCLLAFSQMPD
jgi:hypothetical protein